MIFEFHTIITAISAFIAGTAFGVLLMALVTLSAVNKGDTHEQ